MLLASLGQYMNYKNFETEKYRVVSEVQGLVDSICTNKKIPELKSYAEVACKPRVVF
jgi:hypothetical protein